MNENVNTSVSSSRLGYLDFLRGFAVLGLLLMNAPLMGVSEFAMYIPHQPELLTDSIVRGLNALFFDGRFRSLFCLMFGIGLYLQYTSYTKKGLNAHLVLKSRLKWLFLFGFLHALFIWFGDVLMLYAMCGAVLLGRLEDDAEALVKKGVIWLLIGQSILIVVSVLAQYGEPLVTRDSEVYQQALALTKSGYFNDWQNNLALAVAFVITFPFLSMFSLTGAMMIGIGLFKSGKLKTGFNKSELTKLMVITLVVTAVDFILAVFYLEVWTSVANVLGGISGLTMALLIWHLVLVSKIHEKANLLVTAIRRVGEMALTFYIMQSIIVTVLLQVVFPHWLETFSLLNYMQLSFAVMALQLVIALLYKRPNKQGPLEFIWRKLVNRAIMKQTETVQT